jgi:hypothetical protein
MILCVVLGVAFGALQLFAGHISNPAVRRDPQWDSATTRQLAAAACFDCHSNQTSSHWYEHVAPVSWWIQGHVKDGRARLNFDQWNPAQHKSGQDIAKTITEGSMPPSYYTWFGLHAAANLSASQRAALVRGLEATIGPAVGVQDRRGRGQGGD